MEKIIHGFDANEVVELYNYLCIYESELKLIVSKEAFVNRFYNHKELEQLIAGIVLNYCTKEFLKVIGLVPVENLVSMTKCRNTKTLSFLHHLRNSIAHGQIEKDGDYIHLIDYVYENNEKVYSARGKIKSNVIFEIVQLSENTIR